MKNDYPVFTHRKFSKYVYDGDWVFYKNSKKGRPL